MGAGADYLCYDIHLDTAVVENDVYRLLHRRRTMPDGHPRAMDYDTVPDGWVSGTDVLNLLATQPESQVSWQGDVPTDPEMTTAVAGNSGGNNTGGAGGAGPSKNVCSGAPSGTGGGATDPFSDKVKLERVRELLIEVGLSTEMVRSASRAELWVYLRSRLNI